MLFHDLGNRSNPAILFFHAIGVTGSSSLPLAQHLKEHYYCIIPTSTAYCPGQVYRSKEDELRQIDHFLRRQKVQSISLVVASSLGADLAIAFLRSSNIPVAHAVFDSGIFMQRRILSPSLLYCTIKALYRTGGAFLNPVRWYSAPSIKPSLIQAARNTTRENFLTLVQTTLVKKSLPSIPEEIQKKTIWIFGGIDRDLRYRANFMEIYPNIGFPLLKNYDHMELQVQHPEEFAAMLDSVIKCRIPLGDTFLCWPENGSGDKELFR